MFAVGIATLNPSHKVRNPNDLRRHVSGAAPKWTASQRKHEFHGSIARRYM